MQISSKEKSGLQQFRDYLDNDFGIDERKIQNLIIQDPKQPFSEDDLAGVGYALHGRSDNALLTDRAKKAIKWRAHYSGFIPSRTNIIS